PDGVLFPQDRIRSTFPERSGRSHSGLYAVGELSCGQLRDCGPRVGVELDQSVAWRVAVPGHGTPRVHARFKDRLGFGFLGVDRHATLSLCRFLGPRPTWTNLFQCFSSRALPRRENRLSLAKRRRFFATRASRTPSSISRGSVRAGLFPTTIRGTSRSSIAIWVACGRTPEPQERAASFSAGCSRPEVCSGMSSRRCRAQTLR